MNELSNSPYADKDDPWSSHTIIAGWLQSLPRKSVILDIGTATGTIGRFCDGRGFIRKGIEPNRDWAEQARPYYEHLVISSIENAGDEFIRTADAVVLGDILEHLPYPEATLNRVAGLQQPECLFLISVPNVANIWVRLNLLFGRFEYSQRGILDRTHLRFFTKASFTRLLNQCNLDCREFKTTCIPLNIVHPFFKSNSFGRYLHRILAAATQLLPSLLGYQFVALAMKRGVGKP